MRYETKRIVSCGFILVASLVGRIGPNPAWATIEQSPKAQTAPEPTRKFKLILMSNGVTKCGSPFSQNTYETESGEKIYDLNIHSGSSKEAGKEFASVMDNATRIIDRGESKNNSGITQVRALVEIKARDGRTISVIVRWSGSVVHEIQSFSTEIALQFEKQAETETNYIDRKH